MSVQIERGGISAAGATGSPVSIQGTFNLTVSGSFVATAVCERSYDGGASWAPLAYPDGSPIVIGGPLSLAFEEPQRNVLYRMRALTWTAGELAWRFSR